MENNEKILNYSYFETPIGKMIGVFLEEKLCFLDFLNEEINNKFKEFEKYEELNKISKKLNAKLEYRETKESENLKLQLNEYFNKKRKNFDISLLFIGTEFQKNVWKTLQTIEYGKTISYLEESQKLGNPLAVRAVGTANGKNPISIIVPCHRVIQKNGNIGGYTGGIDKKLFLLKLEGVNVE